MADDSALTPAAGAPLSPRKRTRSALAKEAFEAGFDGKMSRQEVDSTVSKTRRGMRAAAPAVTAALIDKAIRGKASPTDVRAAMFLLAGSGVTQTGAPLTEAERRALDAENERLDATTSVELAHTLKRDMGIETVPEPRE